MRVMIVDDDPGLLKALKRLLSQEIEATTYSDVKEALRDLVAGGAYDAILSDVCMRPISGEQFRERVREYRPELASRFVFMSGGADDPTFQPFLSSVKYLQKPFSMADALAALRQVAL